VNRSLRSVLNQTYKNLEIIIIGDCCTDNTEEVVAALNDQRIRFVNLPQRGQYPSDPNLRWMVAGTVPTNHALELATGDYITHLDDDDEFAADRIEKLVEFISKTQADFVYHPFLWEAAPDNWIINDAIPLELGKVTTSAIFYHKWLKQIPWDTNAYLVGEPADWNRVRRMLEIGVKAERHSEALTRHHRERTNHGV
jgi:glycosyltransferase involved in cell wall biosynthesis